MPALSFDNSLKPPPFAVAAAGLGIVVAAVAAAVATSSLGIIVAAATAVAAAAVAAAVVAAVARSNVAYALMHMQGSPQTMQQAPSYNHVVAEVSTYLRDRFAACVAAGIEANRLLVDPGFGVGKTLEHNLALLRELPSARVEDCPILVGLSRKTMIGRMTGQPVAGRLSGSLAVLLLALQNGADLVLSLIHI